MNEDQLAEMEACEADTSDNYFGARAILLDNGHNRHIFRAGFERGYKIAIEKFVNSKQFETQIHNHPA